MPPPEVTGLKPARGPESGGVVVTVRGSNLGIDQNDVIDVFFRGTSCNGNVTFVSASKLQCMLPPGEGTGPVVVTTRSGGTGTSTVEFTYELPMSSDEDDDPEVDKLTEVDYWVDDEAGEKTDMSINSAKMEDPLELRQPGHPSLQLSNVYMDKLKELYPQGSALLNSDQFVPAFCLAQFYKDLTRGQILEGRQKLAQVCARQGGATQVLLNTHAGTFIDAFEAMSIVDAQIKNRKDTVGLTNSLKEAVQVPNKNATKIFEPMLDRRRMCEKDRIALNVLRQNSFLFSLPKILKSNVEAEAWGTVIGDYQRAKSLFEKTTIRVFEQILEVVEDIIADVRTRLFDKLKKQPLAYEDMNLIIGYLYELESTEDPADFCLEQQLEYVLHELQKSEEALDVPSETAQNSRWESLRSRFRTGLRLSTGSNGKPNKIRSGSSIRSIEIFRNISAAYDNQMSSKSSLAPNHQAIVQRESIPQQMFVESMSQNLNIHLPSMWKLGQSKLQRNKRSDQRRRSIDDVVSRRLSVANLSEQQEEDSVEVEDDGVEYDNQQMALEAMMMKIVESYSEKIRTQVLIEPGSIRDQSKSIMNTTIGKRDWLPKCEMAIRKTLIFLRAVKLSEASLSGIVDLLLEFQKYTFKAVMNEVTAEVRMLSMKEDWKPADNGLHTSLPELYEEMMISAMNSLSELCHNPADDKFFEDGEAEELICCAQEALTTCFTRLAFEGQAATVEGKSTNSVEKEKRLMLIMSNCLYTRKHVARTIAQKFDTLQLGLLGNAFDSCLSQLENLDFQCFDSLLSRRSDELAALAVKSILPASRPQNYYDLKVRNYMKEILLNFVRVHANVNEYSRPFVYRVIYQLAVRIASKLYSVIRGYPMLGNDNDKLSVPLLQLEIAAIKSILSGYDRKGNLWEPLEQLLQSKEPTEKPTAQSPRKRRSSIVGSGNRRRGVPAIPPASSRTKSVPNVAKALPNAGGRRPAPASQGGKKSLPAPGRATASSRKNLPTPGSRGLPAPGAAGRKAPTAPTRGSGRKGLPTPGKAIPTPGKPAKGLPTPGGKALPKAGARGNRKAPEAPKRGLAKPNSSSKLPTAPGATGNRRGLPKPSPSDSDLLLPTPTSSEPSVGDDEPWNHKKVVADALERFLKSSSFQYACFKDPPKHDDLDDEYERELQEEALPDLPSDEDEVDEDEMV